MKAIILVGSADVAKKDIDSFREMCKDFDCMAIGVDAIDKCDVPINYIATYHYEDYEKIKEKMDKRGEDIFLIHHKDKRKNMPLLVNMVVPYEPPSGSSALLGALAALGLGYKKIVLCGCPLSGRDGIGYDYSGFHKGWTNKSGTVRPFVRSMSGFVQGLLGAPTKEWLSEGE